MKTKRKTTGFTLIEGLIVFAIVAVLVVLLIPVLNMYIDRARIANLISLAQSYQAAVSACIINNNGDQTGCNSGTHGIPGKPPSP